MVMAAGWQVDWSPRRVRPPQTASDWSSGSARCFWCGATPRRALLLGPSALVPFMHLLRLLFITCGRSSSSSSSMRNSQQRRVKQKRLMTRGAEFCPGRRRIHHHYAALRCIAAGHKNAVEVQGSLVYRIPSRRRCPWTPADNSISSLSDHISVCFPVFGGCWLHTPLFGTFCLLELL